MEKTILIGMEDLPSWVHTSPDDSYLSPCMIMPTRHRGYQGAPNKEEIKVKLTMGNVKDDLNLPLLDRPCNNYKTTRPYV